MENFEEFKLSESEEDEDDCEPSISDPTFESKEERDAFLEKCAIKTNDSEDNIDYSFLTKKVCTCQVCDDIYSGSYEHICCQQYDKCRKYVKENSNVCITETEAFTQATNHFALRNLLLQMHRSKMTIICDPPKNKNMRFAFYRVKCQNQN